MIKFFVLTLFLYAALFADESQVLDQSLQSILGMKNYNANKTFLATIFKQKARYSDDTRVDLLRVLQTLKENRIINLSLKGAQPLTLSFKTQGSSTFFIKTLSDALRNLGYYKYTTINASKDGATFIWSIQYSADRMIDPLLLEAELAKVGLHIVGVQIETPSAWNYEIDMKNAHLHVEKLDAENNINIEQLSAEKWLEISSVSKLAIISDSANSWYPYVSFYDRDLNLLKVEKVDKKTSLLNLNVPLESVYMKISDIYMLSNIKNGLNIEAKESR